MNGIDYDDTIQDHELLLPAVFSVCRSIAYQLLIAMCIDSEPSRATHINSDNAAHQTCSGNKHIVTASGKVIGLHNLHELGVGKISAPKFTKKTPPKPNQTEITDPLDIEQYLIKDDRFSFLDAAIPNLRRMQQEQDVSACCSDSGTCSWSDFDDEEPPIPKPSELELQIRQQRKIEAMTKQIEADLADEALQESQERTPSPPDFSCVNAFFLDFSDFSDNDGGGITDDEYEDKKDMERTQRIMSTVNALISVSDEEDEEEEDKEEEAAVYHSNVQQIAASNARTSVAALRTFRFHDLLDVSSDDSDDDTQMIPLSAFMRAVGLDPETDAVAKKLHEYYANALHMRYAEEFVDFEPIAIIQPRAFRDDLSMRYQIALVVMARRIANVEIKQNLWTGYQKQAWLAGYSDENVVIYRNKKQ